MGTIDFTYIFEPEDRSWRKTVVVTLDSETFRLLWEPPEDPPPWTRLTECQCAMCPLKETETPYCPAAMSLVEPVGELGELLSYRKLRTTVTSAERTTWTVVPAQRALSSLLGLRMATSGCPVLARFKPMARFHLPFSTRDETLFRVVGMYLIAQYFRHSDGHEVDWTMDGLRRLYYQIHEVNMAVSRRLRNVVAGDAPVNAVVRLDLLAQEMPASIERHLAEFEPLFRDLAKNAPV